MRDWKRRRIYLNIFLSDFHQEKLVGSLWGWTWHGGQLFPEGQKQPLTLGQMFNAPAPTAEMQLQLTDQMFTPVGSTRDLRSELESLTGVLFHGW